MHQWITVGRRVRRLRSASSRREIHSNRVDRIERGLKKIQLVSGASAGCPGAHSEDLLNLGAIQVRGVETDRPFPSDRR